MARIRLENVSKVYKGGVKAVNGASLEIKDKEFVVFVGPSGCGKSTTLRMIAGLEDITSGNLFIGDRYVNDLEPKDRNIAMVFQNYALYPHMTVYENMAYSLRCHHEKKEVIEEKVKKAAEILGIKNLLKRTPRELSGGQRQRVALGRAIVREPDVFLFDEPLSNLDAKLRIQMRAEISKLHKDVGTTFVYVTHDQTEAMTMGDRIVVMKDGYIQQIDTPMNLYEHPVNIFVATFLGSPQMNIIEGVIEKKEDGKYFVSPGQELKVRIPDIDLCQVDEAAYPLQACLGVRPADIKIGEEGFPTVVELVERLGEQTLVYFHLPGRKEYTIASMGPGCRLLEKDPIKVSFNLEKLHLFDKETEQSLTNAVPLIKRPLKDLGTAELDALSRRQAVKGVAPSSYSFLSSDVKEEAMPEGIKIAGIIEGSKEYEDGWNYFARSKDGSVISFRSGKRHEKGKEIALYVPLEKINLVAPDGERLTDDVDIEGEVYEASLAFRPRGCFLKEEVLHNHEKAYKIEHAIPLGRKTILHLAGSEKGEKLLYLVESNDLIYDSMMVYMRKRLK